MQSVPLTLTIGISLAKSTRARICSPPCLSVF